MIDTYVSVIGFGCAMAAMPAMLVSHWTGTARVRIIANGLIIGLEVMAWCALIWQWKAA